MHKVILKNIMYYWRSTLSIIVILVLIGLAFIYTFQTSEHMKVQATEQLTKNWRTGYDLLIRPKTEEMAHKINLRETGKNCVRRFSTKRGFGTASQWDHT